MAKQVFYLHTSEEIQRANPAQQAKISIEIHRVFCSHWTEDNVRGLQPRLVMVPRELWDEPREAVVKKFVALNFTSLTYNDERQVVWGKVTMSATLGLEHTFVLIRSDVPRLVGHPMWREVVPAPPPRASPAKSGQTGGVREAILMCANPENPLTLNSALIFDLGPKAVPIILDLLRDPTTSTGAVNRPTLAEALAMFATAGNEADRELRMWADKPHRIPPGADIKQLYRIARNYVLVAVGGNAEPFPKASFALKDCAPSEREVAFGAAWFVACVDRKLHPDERVALDALKEEMGIADEVAGRVENDARKRKLQVAIPKSGAARWLMLDAVVRVVAADKVLTPKERTIVERLGSILRLDPLEVASLLKGLAPGQDAPGPSSLPRTRDPRKLLAALRPPK